jgi:hypothetical protein
MVRSVLYTITDLTREMYTDYKLYRQLHPGSLYSMVVHTQSSQT